MGNIHTDHAQRVNIGLRPDQSTTHRAPSSLMPSSYHTLMAIWSCAIMVLTAIILFKRVARGQRLHDIPVGPRSSFVSKSLAWKLMTLPSVPSILGFYALAGGFTTHALSSPQTVFVGLYCLHYLYRSVVYPRRIRTSEQQYSLVLVLLTWSYYIPMGYFLGTHLAVHDPVIETLYHPTVLLGLIVFVLGLVSTIAHDEILIRLRSKPSKEYAIPMRGLFRYTSNAHYFSEFIEWTGFALMVMTLPAVLHLMAVFILMLPQALKTHSWYHRHFGAGYPGNRTAFFPFLF